MKIMWLKPKKRRKPRKHQNQAAPLPKEENKITKKKKKKQTFSIMKMKMPKQIDWPEKPRMPNDWQISKLRETKEELRRN